MNFSKKLYIMVFALCTIGIYCYSQDDRQNKFPKVGDIIEDHVFTDVDNYENNSLKLSDFRGKWVILDFWGRTCSGCIASFPKMNALNKDFKGDVKIIMAGSYNSGEWGIRENDYAKTKAIWEQMKAVYNIEFTTVFDSIITEKYNIRALPMIFVINPEGKIVAKTVSINANQIEKLLDGEHVFFHRAFSADEIIEYDKNLPFLTSGAFENGGVDTAFIYRSMLLPYNYNLPIVNNTPLSRIRNNWTVENGRLEVAKYTLTQLLRVAYFGTAFLRHGDPNYGKASNKLILETKDTSVFVVDYGTLKGLYSYSLIVPPLRSNGEILKKMMREDLHRFFNIDTRLEERLMDVYSLEIINQELVNKLKTKGENSQFIYNEKVYKSLHLINQPIVELKSLLLGHYYGDDELPIVDNTGIEYNIDIDFSAKKPDLEGINDVLKLYGLILKKIKQPLQTIVVVDN